MDYQQVLQFWFGKACQGKWFASDEQFDARVRESFGTCWQAACRGELYPWRETLRGRLAEIIVLDQFSRNLNRQHKDAWAQDGMALILSQEALSRPDWDTLSADERSFMLMPWMHSESASIHQRAAELFSRLAGPGYIEHERQHAEVISRFGRYPHRNEALGRTSTPEELAYIAGKTAPHF